MKIQPYLFFNGRCEEASQFYCEKLGAEVESLMRFKEMPESEKGYMPEGAEEKVMHMSLRIGDSTILASDGICNGESKFEGVSLTLIVTEAAEAERFFNLLAQDGEIQMPLAETFFSPKFGAVADRFGVSWMIYAE